MITKASVATGETESYDFVDLAPYTYDSYDFDACSVHAKMKGCGCDSPFRNLTDEQIIGLAIGLFILGIFIASSFCSICHKIRGSRGAADRAKRFYPKYENTL